MRRMARLDTELNARLQVRAGCMLHGRGNLIAPMCQGLNACPCPQTLCNAAAAEHRGVRFHVRQLGGVAASRSSRQPHQIWIDVQYADVGGRVGGDLYVLQPPSAPAEAPPPPESPPDVFGSDDDDHPCSAAEAEEEGSRLLSRVQLPFLRRNRQGRHTDPSIALITVVEK